jgi:hypothetical protein
VQSSVPDDVGAPCGQVETVKLLATAVADAAGDGEFVALAVAFADGAADVPPPPQAAADTRTIADKSTAERRSIGTPSSTSRCSHPRGQILSQSERLPSAGRERQQTPYHAGTRYPETRESPLRFTAA